MAGCLKAQGLYFKATVMPYHQAGKWLGKSLVGGRIVKEPSEYSSGPEEYSSRSAARGSGGVWWPKNQLQQHRALIDCKSTNPAEHH